MRALATTSLLIILLAGCGKEPSTIAELSEAGEKAFVNQEYAKAREYLSKAVAQKPSDQHLLYLLGISYERDCLYDSAFQYLKRADLLFPEDRETNLALYKVAKTIEEWKSAIEAVHVLIETGDPLEQYYGELGYLNMKVENYRVAYYFYRKLLEKDPGNPNNYLQVANLAADNDSLGVALAVIDSALQRFGSNDQFLLNKTVYLTALQRFAEAETILRSMLDRDTSSLSIKLNLAHTLASQNSREKKKEAYQLYLQLQPVAGDEFRLDSLIDLLREELNIKN